MNAATAVAILSLSITSSVDSFSAPRSSFTRIESWEKVVNPPAQEGLAGSLYGPNWSVDENFKPIQTDQKTGGLVWAIGNSTYVHPEMRPDTPVGEWLRSRPNLGICMSGGGQRAATCALGWYRALNHLGLLQKARYVGANSGATWATLPLFCRQILQMKETRTMINYAEYVGEYKGKVDTSGEVDQDDLGVMGKNLLKTNVMNFNRDNEMSAFNDWCQAIEKNYVDPIMSYGGFKQSKEWMQDLWLDLSNAYLWNTKADEGILNKDSFPFPIFVATGYESKNNKEFVPIENSPLYSGIPVDPRKLGLDTTLGGGFVQGVALNSAELENTDPVPISDTDTFQKQFKNPSPVVKVAELTGASSNFGASGDAMMILDVGIPRFLNPLYFFASLFDKKLRSSDLRGFTQPGKYNWWSPTTGGKPVQLNFVDGGMFDNLGVLAVLRRGCSTVIVCDACDGDVCETPEKDVPSKFYDVAALFGVSKPFLPDWILKKGYKDTVNERSQVFESKEFDSLMNDMRKLRKEGKPLVVRKKLKLLKNELAGIYEPGEVDMIFCFNGIVEEFQKDCRDASGDNFPYIDTTLCEYSLKQINDLSALNAYNLVEGLKNADFDIDQVEAGNTAAAVA